MTLKDVAAASGLSVGTVSDIVNRGLAGRYAEATQKKVAGLIAEMGYRPARAAQDLRRGRSFGVGVVLVHGFENPFYARLYGRLQAELLGRGLTAELIVLASVEAGSLAEAAERLSSRGVDGLVVGPVYPWDKAVLGELRALTASGLPVTPFGAIGHLPKVGGVAMDDDAGGAAAAEYLLARGHERLAFLGAYPPADARLGRGSVQQGFSRVLSDAGLQRKAWMLPCGDRSSYAELFEAADAFARRWLDASPDARPTAVLAKTDQIAIPLLSALHLRGVAVPADLSVMGYDNVPESGYTVPALTTVDNGIDARCAAIAASTAERLGVGPGDPLPAPAAPRLVERASVRAIG